MRALPEKPDKLITIMGPSKTESLSGFRLGVGYGTPEIITRMEKLQAVVPYAVQVTIRQLSIDGSLSRMDGWRNVLLITDRSAMIFLPLSTAALDAGLVQQKAEAISSCSFPKLKVDIFQFTKLCRAQASVTVTPGTEFGKQYGDLSA